MAGINFELKYAYTEIYEIVKWLGEDYKNKIPKKIYNLIKNERKIDYRPQFDFKNPLYLQPMKQETKNIIAYLYCYYWCENEQQKKEIIAQIEENVYMKKEEAKRKRMEEIRMRAQAGYVPVTASVEQQMRKNNN